MIGLADFVAEHSEAVEHDLLINTSYTLDDIGGGLSWRALKSFLSSTSMDSAIVQDVNPDIAKWGTTAKTNEILADIYDQLSIANARLYTLITHKKGKRPEPYKRPGMDKKKEQHIGSKPMASVADMRNWIASKMRKEVNADG